MEKFPLKGARSMVTPAVSSFTANNSTSYQSVTKKVDLISLIQSLVVACMIIKVVIK